MRINVYTEELRDVLEPMCKIVTAEYVSSRTNEPMKNYGLRVYLKSAPELHFIPGRDDDRSAITFWCGPKERNVFAFLDTIRDLAYAATLTTWHDKTRAVTDACEASSGANEPPVRVTATVAPLTDRNYLARAAVFIRDATLAPGVDRATRDALVTELRKRAGFSL
jgi:hypothetical protein